MHRRTVPISLIRCVGYIALVCVFGNLLGCSRFTFHYVPKNPFESPPVLYSPVSFFNRCAPREPLFMTRPAWVESLKARSQSTTGPIRRYWYECQEKVARYQEEANAPPWPKFHSVPVEPAFTPREPSEQPVPDAFGAFGAAP
ncbi:MAG: hypothetical protein KGQ51_16965 [Planctomycetes bacterium]|nr:hypothetical protein [Planctomycetota bacterium]